MSIANQKRLLARDQLQQWGTFALMALLLIGIVLFVFLVLLPDVNRRAEYIHVLTSAKTELRVAQQAQLEAPAKLQTQLSNTNGRLKDVAIRFLNEAESTIIVNRLDTYAEAAGVNVVNLQATPPVVTPTYSQRGYRFQVAGKMASLLRFLGSIEEVALPGFVVNRVSIIPDPASTMNLTNGTENTHMLAMNVTVVASPYSERTVLEPDQNAAAYVNIGDLPLAEVQRQVEMAWAARDWNQAINLLGRVTEIAPTNNAARLALYRAYVNSGYHSLNARDETTAKTEFETALTVQPQGPEAITELQQLMTDSSLSHRVEDQIRQALAQARADANWQEAIRLLRLIAAVDPEYGPVGEELTQAYINYGNQLTLAGDTVGAEEQYRLAQYPTAGQQPAASGAVVTATQPVTVSLVPPLVPFSVVAPAATFTATPLPTAPPLPTQTPIPTATDVRPATSTPTVTRAPNVATQVLPPTATYVVQPGDTLHAIAQRLGTSVEALRAANGLTSNAIVVGQVLFIALSQSPAPSYIEHTVAPNETLYSLAQRYGTSAEAIMQMNGLPTTSIYIGQRLLIPTPLSRLPQITPLALAAN